MALIRGELHDLRDPINTGHELHNALSYFAAEEIQHANTFDRYVRVVTQAMLNQGTKAGRRVKPPGWLGDAADHTRGHLLAKSLGGDGKIPENIAIMYARVNNEDMVAVEEQIYTAVDAGHNVRYEAWPEYANPSDLIPSAIRIKATGGGLNIDETIPNVP
jgi:hypothetical protein